MSDLKHIDRYANKPVVGCGIAVLLLTAGVFVYSAGEAVQRQTLAAGGGYSTGEVDSGQAGNERIEMTMGQFASLPLSSGSDRVFSGHLNTNHAPETVSGLFAVMGSSEGTVQLTWNSPGADGAVGNASEIILKVSNSPITTQAQFESATTYAVYTPLALGGFETKISTGLPPGPDYYFAVEARDTAKNQASLSNVVSTNTFGVAPATITDLAAVSGGTAGTASLTWTSPGDDGTIGDLNPGQFRIDYSTDPAHVFTFTTYQVLIATIATTGSAQNAALSGLIGNATAYIGVFSGDDLPVFSNVSNVVTVLTLAYPPAAASYSAVSDTTFTTNWTLNNNNPGTGFFVEISAAADFSNVLASSGWTTSLSATFSGLATDATYFARVKARNMNLVETAFTDLGSITLVPGLAPPIGLAIASDDRRLRLTWNAVLSGNPTGVRVYRSTVSASGPFTAVTAVGIEDAGYTDTGLVNGQTYYYGTTAFADSVESALSEVVSGVPRDSVKPQGVAGLRGARGGDGYVIRWTPSRSNEDGTEISDLLSYRIYRLDRDDLDGTPALIGTVSAAAELAFTDPQSGLTVPQWYFVRAFDTSDNESIDSPWTLSPSPLQPTDLSGNVRFDIFWVSPDRKAFLQVPNQTADALEANDTVILWNRHPEEENGRVASAWEVIPVSASQGQRVARYKFPSTRTNITFRYTPPPTSTAQPLAPNTVFRPEDLAVFHHNGVEFVKLGGRVDTSANAITVVSRAPGKYIVKQTLRATSFVVLQTAPRKIFTPNDDGVNDIFQIYFENPNDSMISYAKVFDLSGAEVADLQVGLSGNALSWDGRGRDGDISRGGIFIYHIQAEGKAWNGTMVLAK